MDGSPGAGCPVIASLTGTDLALVVTGPALSGVHEMERIFELARHFKIPAAACINKYDVNMDNAEAIDRNADGACHSLGACSLGIAETLPGPSPPPMGDIHVYLSAALVILIVVHIVFGRKRIARGPSQLFPGEEIETGLRIRDSGLEGYCRPDARRVKWGQA